MIKGNIKSPVFLDCIVEFCLFRLSTPMFMSFNICPTQIHNCPPSILHAGVNLFPNLNVD